MIASKELKKLGIVFCMVIISGIFACFSSIGILALICSAVFSYFWCLRTKPDFFLFYGKGNTQVTLNRYIIDRLTTRQVSKLSEVERRFVEYCKDNQEFKMHITLQCGAQMTQIEVCRMMFETFIKSREEILASEPIDMAKLLAVEPGPND